MGTFSQWFSNQYCKVKRFDEQGISIINHVGIMRLGLLGFLLKTGYLYKVLLKTVILTRQVSAAARIPLRDAKVSQGPHYPRSMTLGPST